MTSTVRKAWRRIPLSLDARQRIKDELFKRAPLPFRRMEAYRNWLATWRHAWAVERGDRSSWGIVTTPDTSFFAELIACRLRDHGWRADSMTAPPEAFSHDYYIVICPRRFGKLPPEDKRIVFPMEPFDRIDVLKNSIAVLDCSIRNMARLEDRGMDYPDIHYLPAGGSSRCDDGATDHEKSGILVYGNDLASPERQRTIAALRERFDVFLPGDTAGRDIRGDIQAARIVVNFRCRENPSSATMRIWECLSSGTPVMSEAVDDRDEHPEFAGVVEFFEEGSTESLLRAVERASENPVAGKDVYEAVAASERRFRFMFDRFLVATNFLPEDHAHDMDLPVSACADQIAISMPETAERRSFFLRQTQELPLRYVLFDGIRRQPGWVGCGLSHAMLARHALNHGIGRLTIMEDDVVFPDRFCERLAIVNKFLDTQLGEWDWFSGISGIADPAMTVSSVVQFEGITFAIVNRTVTTVFNIYSERGLRILASWNPQMADGPGGNIDQFLRRQKNLRIVVACPFLVEHRKECRSTVGNVDNRIIWDVIRTSQAALQKKISKHRAGA